jgi:5'(3')-deoxyribonucleotidase
MTTANTMVTALAAATGMLLVSSPNTNQHKVPNAKSEYINNEIPDVSFVRMVFNACGRKEIVVKNAAIKPIIVIIFIIEK